MKHVTVLAVFQFTRGENGASWPRSASRAPSSRPACVAREPPEADIFCQSGAHLGVVRGHEGIRPRKFPLLPIFFRCELVIGPEMPLQH
jgi:hypothetical protein